MSSSSLIEAFFSHGRFLEEFEDELSRNPFSLKTWWNYLNFLKKSDVPALVLLVAYERSVRYLPGSYKLWWNYLQFRIQHLTAPNTNSTTTYTVASNPQEQANSAENQKLTNILNSWESVNNCFERALLTLSKMPRIWLDYARWLQKQRYLRRTREVLDRALQSLPVSQHDSIWKQYKEFLSQSAVPGPLAVKIYKRYLKISTIDEWESFLGFTRQKKAWSELYEALIYVLQNPEIISVGIHTQSQQDLLMELSSLVKNHSTEIENSPTSKNSSIISVPSTIHHLMQFPKLKPVHGDLIGTLAIYYIGKGQFEKARDVFEEGMQKIETVQGFTTVFNAYSKFEEEFIEMQMSELNNLKDDLDNEKGKGKEFIAKRLEKKRKIEEMEKVIELAIEKLEYLTDRRSLLLNYVQLKQNPENVSNWLKRISLFKERNDDISVLKTFETAWSQFNDAITKRKQIFGKISKLVLTYAAYLEQSYNKGSVAAEQTSVASLEPARNIFNRALAPILHNINKNSENQQNSTTTTNNSANSSEKQQPNLKPLPNPKEYIEIIRGFVEMEIRHGDLEKGEKHLEDVLFSLLRKEELVVFKKTNKTSTEDGSHEDEEFEDSDEKQLGLDKLTRFLENPPLFIEFLRALCDTKLHSLAELTQKDDPYTFTRFKVCFFNASLWSLYLDVIEGQLPPLLGFPAKTSEAANKAESAAPAINETTFTVLRTLYDTILHFKISTPENVLNYVELLESASFYEESFRVFERSIPLYCYPQVYHLWIHYIIKFLKRYKGKKIERLRDICEQALEDLLPQWLEKRKILKIFQRQFASEGGQDRKSSARELRRDISRDMKNLFLLYASIEEQYGLTKNSMAIFERGIETFNSWVDSEGSQVSGGSSGGMNNFKILRDSFVEEDKSHLFHVYIEKAAASFGISKTREIYTKAVESMKDSQLLKQLCLEFADLEEKLGEIDRSRSIFVHCSKFCNPDDTKQSDFWTVWENFEKKNGNKESLLDLFKIKRSVKQIYLNFSNV